MKIKKTTPVKVESERKRLLVSGEPLPKHLLDSTLVDEILDVLMESLDFSISDHLHIVDIYLPTIGKKGSAPEINPRIRIFHSVADEYEDEAQEETRKEDTDKQNAGTPNNKKTDTYVFCLKEKLSSPAPLPGIKERIESEINVTKKSLKTYFKRNKKKNVLPFVHKERLELEGSISIQLDSRVQKRKVKVAIDLINGLGSFSGIYLEVESLCSRGPKDRLKAATAVHELDSLLFTGNKPLFANLQESHIISQSNRSMATKFFKTLAAKSKKKAAKNKKKKSLRVPKSSGSCCKD
jgi:hypothetical protein